jgi:enoyl-CoA hydratase/carnithine racemase
VVTIDRPERANATPLAMEHILLGDPIAAERAHELGLVNRIVPAADVVSTSVELAERICANAPQALCASNPIARAALGAAEVAGWQRNDEVTAALAASAGSGR